jgi:hypothetical protein
LNEISKTGYIKIDNKIGHRLKELFGGGGQGIKPGTGLWVIKPI